MTDMQVAGTTDTELNMDSAADETTNDLILVEIPTDGNPKLAGGAKRYQLFTQECQLVTQRDTSSAMQKAIDGDPKILALQYSNIVKMPFNDFLAYKREKVGTPESKVKFRTTTKESTYVPTESVSEYSVHERFRFFDKFITMFGKGEMNGLVIVGNKGLGKSTRIANRLQEIGLANKLDSEDGKEGDYLPMSGKTSGAGLYMRLFENRKNMVILDDCNLSDPDCIEFLKAVLDTRKKRWVTSNVMRRDDDPIPSFFQFEGQVALITNKSEAEIRELLGERVPTLNMWMTPAEIIEYIETEIIPGLDRNEFSQSVIDDAFDLLKERFGMLPEFNLRTFMHILTIRKSNDPEWQDLCKVSVLRKSLT